MQRDLEAPTLNDTGYMFGSGSEPQFAHTHAGWGPSVSPVPRRARRAPGPRPEYGPVPPLQSNWRDAPMDGFTPPNGGETPPPGGGNNQGNLRGSCRDAGVGGGDVSASTPIVVAQQEK